MGKRDVSQAGVCRCGRTGRCDLCRMTDGESDVDYAMRKKLKRQVEMIVPQEVEIEIESDEQNDDPHSRAVRESPPPRLGVARRSYPAFLRRSL